MFAQAFGEGYGGGDFAVVVADEDEGDSVAADQKVGETADTLFRGGVESVERFVENQQFGLAYERARKQHEALLA